MKLSEIYSLIDGLAPFSLSREYCEKYGAYDNSGILLNCGQEIEGILFSLDCSLAAVERAKRIGANLIVTHHPAIYAPLKALDADDPVTACAMAGISIISAHLNLDCAKGGIDDCMANALGAWEKPVKMHALSLGGYGSVFAIEATPLARFIDDVRAAFQTKNVMVFGEREEVSKVASFCGAGLDEESLAFAFENDADTVVSSDPKHHLIAQAVEQGLNVLILPHYAAENYGFYEFYQKIEEKCSLVPMEYFEDGRLM